MIILCGPSASGKTEIAKILGKSYGFSKFVTTTTRKIREHEINGIDYNFINKDIFLNKIKNNEFIEYTIYNDNYYGSEKKLIRENNVIILEPKGLTKFKQLKDNTIVSFFLICDENTRISHMKLRGDTTKDINKRIENDKKDFDLTNIKNIDFYIKTENKDLETLTKEIYEKYTSFLKKQH